MIVFIVHVLFLSQIIFIGGTLNIPHSQELQETVLLDSYRNFLLQFGKLNRLKESHLLKKRIEKFKRSLEFIQAHNAAYSQDNLHFELRVNSFADELDEDLRNIFIASTSIHENSHLIQDLQDEAQKHIENDTVLLGAPSPQQLKSLNWATSENPVKKSVISLPSYSGQGSCGACWAFVASHAAQASVNIAFFSYFQSLNPSKELSINSKLMAPALSIQEMIDCDDKSYNHACDGGDPYWALFYILNNGVHPRDAYPAYSQEKEKCVATEIDKRISVTSTEYHPVRFFVGNVQHLLPPFYSQVTSDTVSVSHLRGKMSQYIKEKLIKTGPITVGICGTQNRFLFYAHGIFDDTLCCATQNHAMLLTGFGEDEKTGLKYWTLMNSWGRFWGENGFMRILRYEDNEDVLENIQEMKPFPLEVEKQREYNTNDQNETDDTFISTSSPNSAAELGLCGMFQNPSQATGAFVQDTEKGLLSPSAVHFYFPSLFHSSESISTSNEHTERHSKWSEMTEKLSLWWQRTFSVSWAYFQAHWRDTVLMLSLLLIGLSIVLLMYSFCLNNNIKPHNNLSNIDDSTHNISRFSKISYHNDHNITADNSYRNHERYSLIKDSV